MKLNDLKFEWYAREDVLNNIIRFTKFREVSFLSKKGDKTIPPFIRYKTCWKPEFFTTLLQEYCMNENTNIYISVGKIMFPFTKETFKDKLTGYDLIFDLDGKVTKKGRKEVILIEVARKDTIKIRDELRKFNVPYSVVFSGRKGFQVRVFSKNIPADYIIQDRDKLFSKLAKNIKRKLKLKTLDENQYLITQLIKLPLSYCSGGYICMPLSSNELEQFNKEEYHIKTMLGKKNLTYIFEFNVGISNDRSQENFRKFFEKYK